jgi:hypothetical protein
VLPLTSNSHSQPNQADHTILNHGQGSGVETDTENVDSRCSRSPSSVSTALSRLSDSLYPERRNSALMKSRTGIKIVPRSMSMSQSYVESANATPGGDQLGPPPSSQSSSPAKYRLTRLVVYSTSPPGSASTDILGEMRRRGIEMVWRLYWLIIKNKFVEVRSRSSLPPRS